MQLPTSIPIMASYFMANLTTWGSNAYTTATMWIINTVNGVYQNLLLLPGYCLSVGAYVVTSLIAWLSNAYSTATTWTNNIVNTVYQILKNLPSYCMQAGMQFVANVESWASAAYNAVASWINQIPNLVSTALSNAASSASNWWQGVKASFTIGMEEGSAKPEMALASGGIFRKGAFITSFAEESDEAAIPIDGSNRAIALWQKTGELLGVNNLKNSDTKGKYNKPIVQSVSKTDKIIMMQENEDETSGIKSYMLSGLQKMTSLASVVQLNNTNNTTDKNKITPIFMPVANYNENTNSTMLNPFDIIGKFLNEQSVSNITNNSNIGDNRVNITYSPNINIKSDGKNENLANNVKQALTMDKENLIQLIQKVLKDMDDDKNRLAFN